MECGIVWTKSPLKSPTTTRSVMAYSAATWCQKGAKRAATLSKCIKKDASHATPIIHLLAPFLMRLDRVAAHLAPSWHHLAAELAM